MTKKDAEDDHREERLDDGPGRADYRLLVAHLDVAPREEVQQFAVVPDLAQIHGHPTTRRLDDNFVRARLSIRAGDRAHREAATAMF